MTEYREHIKHFPSLESLKNFSPLEQFLASLQDNMPNHNVQSYFEQKPTLLANADDIAIAWNDSPSGSKIVGLIALRRYMAQEGSPSFVHISTIHIAEAKQKGMLLKRLIASAYLGLWHREGSLPTWTAVKTFNPSTYNVLLRLKRMIGSSAVLYPSMEKEKEGNGCKSLMVMPIAVGIAARLEPECTFDRHFSVIRGGGGIIGGNYWLTAPRSTHNEINHFFDRHLTPADRMLCILGLDEELCKSDALKLITRWANGK
jgi:hypothetical protein